MDRMTIPELRAEISEVEKQRHETKSWKRQKDLGKYLRKLHIRLLKKEQEERYGNHGCL